MTSQNIERDFIKQAINEMEKCSGGNKVGAVLVIDGKIVSTGFKHLNVHAERSAIDSARQRGLDLRGSVLYTTLEPCVELSTAQGSPSCADLIILAGIRKVVIGRFDPNPNVHRRGWRQLRDSSVQLGDFPGDLRNKIDAINPGFMGYFSRGIGPSGGAKVDHKDSATFKVQFSGEDDRCMNIGWTLAGVDAAHGYAQPPVKVGLARFASYFHEIGDPTAYDFSHSARIGVGEIGIFLGA